MLSALIWKDIRVNRLPLMLTAGLTIGSYMVVTIMVNMDPSAAEQSWQRLVISVLAFGSVVSHGTSQLSLTVLAGNLIAVERVDRSAEFLVYLPASRRMVLGAKALLLAAVAVGLLLLHVGGMQIAVFSGLPPSDPDTSFVMMILGISSVGFCGAGVGWLASCTLNSNSMATLLAITAPILAPTVIQLSLLAFDEPLLSPDSGRAIMVAAWVAIGLAGFLWGTRHFLHRVEP